MDREEKKLIDKIRNGLHDFEIPYEEGNWEKFQQKYQEKADDKQRRLRKTPLIFWKYISAAAILIGVLIFMPWHVPEKEYETLTPIARQDKATMIDKGPGSTVAEENTSRISAASQRPVVRETKATASLAKDRILAQNIQGTHRAEAPSTTSLYEDPGTTDPDDPPAITKNEAPSTSAHWKEVSIASNEPQGEPAPAAGRWKFGVEINSSLTSDELHLAAGLLTQFQVSEKIKLSTGLTYSNFVAVHSTSPVQLSYDTKMVGGETMIKAIDIPLTLVYEPSDGWFASVGVSALAVLDEHKIHRMESEVLQETFVMDPESGASVSVFEVVKNEYTEQSTDTDFEGQNNLRYLNLSLGKKHRLNKRTEILFEPFVKIPMGDLKRKDIHLLSSGIKLKLLF